MGNSNGVRVAAKGGGAVVRPEPALMDEPPPLLLLFEILHCFFELVCFLSVGSAHSFSAPFLSSIPTGRTSISGLARGSP